MLCVVRVKGVGLGGSVIVLQNIEACRFTPLKYTPAPFVVTVLDTGLRIILKLQPLL